MKVFEFVAQGFIARAIIAFEMDLTEEEWLAGERQIAQEEANAKTETEEYAHQDMDS